MLDCVPEKRISRGTWKQWSERNISVKKEGKNHANTFNFFEDTGIWRMGKEALMDGGVCPIESRRYVVWSQVTDSVVKWVAYKLCASVGLEASTVLQCKFVQMKLLISYHFKRVGIMSPVSKVSILSIVLLYRLVWSLSVRQPLLYFHIAAT
jgi:hypothetical protein